MAAEARVDELQAQVTLLEGQGLRARLHPAPNRPEAAPASAAATAAARKQPARVIVPTLNGDA